MTEIERTVLIENCERGVVPVTLWQDRDSALSQIQLGKAHALLKAGCEYTVTEVQETTIWIRIAYPGFSAFEYGQDDLTNWDSALFYIPTTERLNRSNGKDWY